MIKSLENGTHAERLMELASYALKEKIGRRRGLSTLYGKEYVQPVVP